MQSNNDYIRYLLSIGVSRKEIAEICQVNYDVVRHWDKNVRNISEPKLNILLTYYGPMPEKNDDIIELIKTLPPVIHTDIKPVWSNGHMGVISFYFKVEFNLNGSLTFSYSPLYECSFYNELLETQSCYLVEVYGINTTADAIEAVHKIKHQIKKFGY